MKRFKLSGIVITFFILNLLISSGKSADSLSRLPKISEHSQNSELSPNSVSPEISSTSSPYGICSHLSIVHLEHQQIPENLKVMKEAGIRWIRTDFSWRVLQKKDGSWDFSMTDRLLDEAAKYQINILPILEHPTTKMIPVIDHLDQWCEYVRQTVTHYKDRLTYWEVWNEHNISKELGPSPKPEYYTELLQRTWETIKEIDPKLIVVYGGLAGCPHDYFEKTLQLGAGRYFEVMNIHPYRSGLRSRAETQKFIDDIQKFENLMNKYILPSRPIWITEMGWPTPGAFAPSEMMIAVAAFSQLFPQGIQGKIAFFNDPNYEICEQFNNGAIESLIPAGCQSEAIDRNQLRQLDPQKYPVLFLPPSQVAPEPFYDAIARYVKKGGTLFLSGGIPFYYGTRSDNDLVMTDTTKYCGMKYCKPLGLSWYAWWTQKNVPQEAPVFLTEEGKAKPRYLNEKLVSLAQKDLARIKGMRFLDDRNLQDGDRIIPLVKAKSENFEGIVAAIYKLNNKEVKGNVIVSTILRHSGNNASEKSQAVNLPQSVLIALSANVEKYFWYEFISEERDPGEREDHFGIVHADLSPKPSYHAYKTLSEVRPNGSVQIWRLLKEDLCLTGWKRPDGKTVWAIWSPFKKITVKCAIKGKIERAVNYLGQPVNITEKTESLALSDEILYLIGPEQIDLL